MNDPGFDKPISDAAEDVHEAKQEDLELKNEEADLDEVEKQSDNVNQDAYIDKVENADAQQDVGWWYASTAFPLFAGTFGPMANAFSLCALVENWRVSIPPGGTEEHGLDIKDPKFLIAVNAISLACAIIGNLSLLLNMARRVRFEIAQPCTILGFWIASVLLIALISVAGTGMHEPGVQNEALTQAYYYAIFAAGLYQIISYLMCVTVWGAYKGAYSKEFKLTIAQRTLMLQTISFLGYQLLGALIYSYIEGWKFLDAFYWSDFTLLTVGIGASYTPKTHLGRSLLFPFAIGGIIILGLVVGSIRSLVLERGQEKMSARMIEKTRERIVKQIAANKRVGAKSTRSFSGLTKDKVQTLRQDPSEDSIDEIRRRKTEFETMREVQEIAAREKQYIALAISTLAFATLWTIGALVFWQAEKNQQWTYFQSLYFAYTSIITVGYGDFEPMSNSGKPFFVFWSLLAIPTLTILISNMGDTVVKGVKDVTIWLGEISVLPSNDASALERLKFGLYKATLGKVKGKLKSADDDDQDQIPEDDHDWDNYRELHPGLVQMFDVSDRRKVTQKDVTFLDKFGKQFEEAEAADEEEARQQRDKRAEAQHHYRRLLISQIRKVYRDSRSSTPKKYSYIEWTFYLRLLGEDEKDSSRHYRPTELSKTGKSSIGTNEGTHSSKKKDSTNKNGQSPDSESQKVDKWSWLGESSPLLASGDEAEWILNRLFQRLEESMHDQWHQSHSNGNKASDAQGKATTSGSDSDRTLGGEARQRQAS